MVNPLVARLSGRPLAIAPRALDELLAVAPSIGARSAVTPILPDAEPATARGFTLTDSGIAVVPVLGPLVSRGDWLTALLGASDYGAIGSAVAAAFAEPAARAVLLEVDSPGGEVGGLFDLVDRLAALRTAAGKPLWAVAHEGALSAAFAIASVADRLYVTRTAEVGSVGVVAIHVDESAADVMAGLKWTLIHAGDRKIDGNAHAPLSEAAVTSPPVTTPTATDVATDQTAEQLRADYAEIAAIAAQGARLGVAIDAADAMAKGITPHALRRAILDRLAARAEASTVVAVAPPPTGSAHPSGGESPIVRRARERASANRS